MHLKKYFVSVVSLLATTQVIATENQNTDNSSNIDNNNIGLNLYLTAEGSLYQNIKFDNFNFKYPRNIMTGGLQAGALYELGKSSTGNLVIGGGVDLYGAFYQNIATSQQGESANIDLKMTSVITKGSVGYKFTPSDRFSIYTLGNVGYGVYNKGSIQFIGLTEPNSEILNSKIKNHFTYGVNLISAFNVTNSFDVGLGVGVTGHSMRIENQELQINQKLNYFDVNTSLNLIYKI